MHILECLTEHAGIARVLDVQIRRLNDVIEERLHLRVAKVASGSVKTVGVFLKELADVVCRDGNYFLLRKTFVKLFQELPVALNGVFPDGSILMLLLYVKFSALRSAVRTLYKKELDEHDASMVNTRRGIHQSASIESCNYTKGSQTVFFDTSARLLIVMNWKGNPTSGSYNPY